jgi:hypothetical protein
VASLPEQKQQIQLRAGVGGCCHVASISRLFRRKTVF